MSPDPLRYAQAGGDPERLAWLGRLGPAAAFSDGDGRALASVHPYSPEVGAISDWTSGPEVLAAAEGWLRDQGCQRVQGPVEACGWFRNGATTGPYDEPPFPLEPTDRAQRWLAAGYQPVAEKVALLCDHDVAIARGRDAAGNLSTSGYAIRALGSDGAEPDAQALAEWLRGWHLVGSEAFKGLPAFQPVPVEAVVQWWAGFSALIEPRACLQVRSPSGELVGAVLTLKHANDPRLLVLHSLAVHPKAQRNGVGTWLVAAAHRAGQKAGHRGAIHANLPAQAAAAEGGRVVRRYQILEKALVSRVVAPW